MSLISTDGDILKEIQNIELEAFSTEYLTLTSHSKGVWYFEFSYISGDMAFLAGFRTYKRREVAIQSSRIENRLYAYSTTAIPLNDNIPSSGLLSVDLNISYLINEHIGIGIDIDNKNIFYLYKNILKAFTFDAADIEWYIGVRELEIDDKKDIISVFLDEKEFVYKPPFAAKAWYSKISKTCLNRSKYILQSFIFCAIQLFVS